MSIFNALLRPISKVEVEAKKAETIVAAQNTECNEEIIELEKKDELEHRLTVAKEELEQASKYDYSVVNDELTSCVKQIAEIINGNI